jgi:hypothetical protein
MAGMSQSPCAEYYGGSPEKDGKRWKRWEKSFPAGIDGLLFLHIYIILYLFWDPHKYHVAVKLGKIN